MTKNNHLEKWIQVLKKRELDLFVATILEATKPLNFIFAQLVYVGKPFFSGHISPEPIMALAYMLEDEDKTNLFIADLREAI